MRSVGSRRGQVGLSGAAFVFLASGCAAPLALPAEGGRPWRQLSSPHFVLQTNVDEAAGQELIHDFERWASPAFDCAGPQWADAGQ